jgi:hypothetical protein
MTNISKNRRIASILVAVATLTVVLSVASTAGREHIAFAFQDFFKGSAHIKDAHGKQVIELPTNLVQNALCKTAGENSPILASCINTAAVITSKTGGIGTIRGSTGDDRKQVSEQPTIIGGTVCETAGESSPIRSSCTNTSGAIISNTGGSSTTIIGGSSTSITGSSSTSITGSSSTSVTGSIKLPFGGFP